LDQIEAEQDGLEPPEVDLNAMLVEGLPLACAPSVTEQAQQSASQVLWPARPLGGKEREGVAGEE
jgi:hypothetical protein